MFQHGTSLEWILFLVSNANLALHIYVVWRTRVDASRVLRAHPTPFAVLLMERDLTSEEVRLVVSVICATAGLIAVNFPPPPGDLTISAQWKGAVITTVSLLSLIAGWIAMRYRRLILEHTGPHQPKKGQDSTSNRRVRNERRSGSDRRHH